MADTYTEISIDKSSSTPLGPIWVAVSERGLVAVEIQAQKDDFIALLSKRFGSIRIINDERSSVVSEQIQEYLIGERKEFHFPIDWTVMRPFQEKALKETYAIPHGKTLTYGQIAHKIGKPNAARAVGRAEATNPMPLVIPCHRVLGADGGLHGYGAPGGLNTKAWLLDLESK